MLSLILWWNVYLAFVVSTRDFFCDGSKLSDIFIMLINTESLQTIHMYRFFSRFHRRLKVKHRRSSFSTMCIWPLASNAWRSSPRRNEAPSNLPRYQKAKGIERSSTRFKQLYGQVIEQKVSWIILVFENFYNHTYTSNYLRFKFVNANCGASIVTKWR